MTLKEISDVILQSRSHMALMDTKTLETNLVKIVKWRDTATDRLEKIAWSDLATFTKQELKRRKSRLSNKTEAEKT
jgi:hypothetical protein